MLKLLFPILVMLGFAQLTPVSDFFTWDRNLILQGEVWRLITGNFTHTNLAHLIMNAAALTVFCFIFKDILNPKKLWGLLLSISLMTGGLLLLSPIQSYVGLSGVLHGLFIWAAIEDIKQQRSTGWLLLVGVVAKIAWEQYFGASASTVSLINANVATEAHLIGACCGAMLQLLYYFYTLSTASDAPK
ncbi:rhombosortase [Aliivibrio sp. S4TY2]|uniref:rhombosortase n=1 Tax=unclassified Aliivibrio TaxID=2645654 RepID=UPI002378F75B|nr:MULTISPECIES: rhombosortase [unclassified Aliivibrio]MDD9154603.1 rhombosortase [Aliivibrio sp. S4TY2]MDD9159034.1 rhombosortase [Aliivibrio sp. S4TY1]MDD9162606.1 rhombosortase [Aliivibrio sp. S4MY2]MDD9167033.1 rhombosortase [Aliivibrio sp. S4MY4]MDD9183683.1 rhombosortase [Aliivibrio sp. S4MY3]